MKKLSKVFIATSSFSELTESILKTAKQKKIILKKIH